MVKKLDRNPSLIYTHFNSDNKKRRVYKMQLMNSFKTTAAGLALFAAATATTAEAAPGSNDAAREQQRRAQSSQTYQQQAPSGSLTARDACRNLAQGPSLQELPATGKAFVSGSDLGCELMRVGNAYTVTKTYDFTMPSQADAFQRSFAAASRMEEGKQRTQQAQQQREDRQNNPIRQIQGVIRDANQGLGVGRQVEGLWNRAKRFNPLGR